MKHVLYSITVAANTEASPTFSTFTIRPAFTKGLIKKSGTKDLVNRISRV